MAHGGHTGLTRRLVSTLGFLSLLLYPPASILGAPAAGFPLQSSQVSPVTGAVTISAPAVTPEPGLLGVQFKLDGYGIEALDTTSPFQIVWSAASTTDGDHTITAEARYSSGAIIESAPLSLTVANPPTFNRTLYVDAATGNDGFDGLGPTTAWRTLGKANGAVQAGDTVLLKGTFSGQVLNPAVSGTAGRPIRFKSAPGGTAVLSGGSSGVAVSLNGDSYIVLEGIRVQNVPGYAVMFDPGSHHNVLRNSVIADTHPTGWGHAVRIQGSSDNLVEGNTITNVGSESSNSGDSIYVLSGAHRNRFLYNTVQNGGHSLFQMSSQNSTAASFDNVIAHNTLSNRWTTPVILTGSAVGVEGTLVEYNKISDGAINGVNFPRPGIQINASNNIIRYNEFFNNAAAGLMLAAYTYNGTFSMDAIGNQIYHNVFYGNNQLGTPEHPGAIEIFEKNDRTVRDNLIANNIFFRNNGFAFDGNTYSITINHYNNPTAWPVGSLNGNRIEHNIVLSHPGREGEQSVLRIRNSSQGGNLSYSLAQFQATYSTAANNLEANPLFVNEATRDFHLQSGSPAIDVGLVITGISFNGNAPDLGAYETAPAGPPDTTAPSVPTGLTASAVSPTQINLSWTASTDNVAVTGYKIFRGATEIGTTPSTSFQNPGLSPSTTYTYTVAAYDAAGNTSAQSTGASATTPATVRSPFLGSPFAIPGVIQAEHFDNGGEGVAYHDLVPGNAGGLYRINVDVDIIANGTGYAVNNFQTGEWLSYSIDVAQAGTYRIEAALSSQFTTSRWHVEIDGVDRTGSIPVPNTGNWNTFQYVGKSGVSLTAGPHILTIYADQEYFNFDSLRIMATGTLLAAYNFNQGSGGTALDSSGNGNHGTISGATWTAQGRYRNALSFDGVNDRVRASTVTLSGAFTLMAWVYNPTNASYETIVTVGTDRDLYLRNGVLTFYDGTADRPFGSAISRNVWHHVAIVSDGSTVRVYLNGASNSTPQTVSLGPVAGALQVGAWIRGNSNYDFFGGRIDEVRVYNRALTQAEVQTDMKSPIAP